MKKEMEVLKSEIKEDFGKVLKGKMSVVDL